MDTHTITGGYTIGNTIDVSNIRGVHAMCCNRNDDGSYEIRYQDADGNLLFTHRVDAQGTSSREYPHRGFRVNNMILDEWQSFPCQTEVDSTNATLGLTTNSNTSTKSSEISSTQKVYQTSKTSVAVRLMNSLRNSHRKRLPQKEVMNKNEC